MGRPRGGTNKPKADPRESMCYTGKFEKVRLSLRPEDILGQTGSCHTPMTRGDAKVTKWHNRSKAGAAYSHSNVNKTR